MYLVTNQRPHTSSSSLTLDINGPIFGTVPANWRYCWKRVSRREYSMYFSRFIVRPSSRLPALPVSLLIIMAGIYSVAAETTPPPVVPQDPSTTEELHDTTPVPSEDKPAPNLSKELKEKEGVITPPRGVDPEIKKPTPENFSSDMPVLRPPGEPGGDQSVQPK